MDLQEFVRLYYLLSGAAVTEMSSQLDLVQVGADAASAMHGPWAQPYHLLLAFASDVAEATPESELVEPGSFRLNQLIGSVRCRGRLSRAYLPAVAPSDSREAIAAHLDRALGGPGRAMRQYYPISESQEWIPHLCLHLVVATVGVDREESLILPAVNLVTGTLCGDFTAFLPPVGSALEACPGVEAGRLLSYKRAYRALIDHAVATVGRRDAGWALQAEEQYQAEIRRLEAFYRGLEKEVTGEEGYATALAEAKRRRLEEQMDRFSPRVLIRPSAAAVVYAPVVVATGVLCGEDGVTRPVSLEYDPVSDGVRERPPVNAQSWRHSLRC